MRANKKATENNRSVLNTFLIVVGVFILFGALFLTWQYFKNKPNYRDLKKEYSKMQIPSDWQLVGESSNKGTWGLFCWQLEGSECPHIIYEYKSGMITKTASNIMNELEQMITKQGYVIEKDDYGLRCTEKNINNENYSCFVVGSREKIVVSVGLYSKNADGDNGNWANITLNKKP